MTDLVATIDQILPFGLQPNLSLPDRDLLLEKSLIKIYQLYFEIKFEFDNNNYPEFIREKFPNVRTIVAGNFKEFGLYKVVIDYDINNLDACGVGDAIDDISDIIYDLLEIKWRIENNSFADGMWFFELVFRTHTKEHILNLLTYMKELSDKK